eukprot:9959738-Alexandrium_andersonii.AAC.1
MGTYDLAEADRQSAFADRSKHWHAGKSVRAKFLVHSDGLGGRAGTRRRSAARGRRAARGSPRSRRR